MRDLLDELDAWRAEGVDAGRAVVVRTFGSAPRPEGAVLLVADDGRIAGSVSGGCVEAAVAEEVAAARATGRQRVIRYGISDEAAWDLGLACGGTIDVLVQPRIADALVEAARAAAAGRMDARAIVTLLPADAPPPVLGPQARGVGEPASTPLTVHADGRLEGTLGDAADDRRLVALALDLLRQGVSRTVEVAARQAFIESFAARPRLVVVGAVEAARTLVRLAREFGYETAVVDGRAAFATRGRFPDADRIVIGWLDEVADEIALGPTDAVAVLTHDAKFDEPAIVTALRRGCRYVGAIGSRRTQAERRARLVEAGVPADELRALRGPIGLDLGGRQPAEMALAILAEVVAVRLGGSGRPLRDVADDAAGGAPDSRPETAHTEAAEAAASAPAQPHVAGVGP